MPMTDAEIRAIAKRLANSIFRDARKAASSDVVSLKAAVVAIDQSMNATTTQAHSLYPDQVVKLVMRDRAKSGAPNLTNTEALICLAYWAMKEAGIL